MSTLLVRGLLAIPARAIDTPSRRVATACGEATGTDSREVHAGIRLFEASTGRVIREMRVASRVAALAFSRSPPSAIGYETKIPKLPRETTSDWRPSPRRAGS